MDAPTEPGHSTEPAGRYQHAFVEGGSYRAAVELVRRSGRTDKDRLIVDLGCGFGAVAEPLRDLGFTYVGTDLASDGLADLAERGFETHVVDLRAPHDDLVRALDEVASGRGVDCLLALDVLEHLADPGAAVAALAGFAAGCGEPDLVVSYPNITHLDVAAKLLVGRWDRTDEGLLDRTHLQFFAEQDLLAMLAASGWQVADAADVVSEHSDQSFPDEAPVVRPDTPLPRPAAGGTPAGRTERGDLPVRAPVHLVAGLATPAGGGRAPVAEVRDRRRGRGRRR